MPKIFFDTNIYNHLNKTQIGDLKESKNSKKIEILTMPQILGELVAYFEKDILETQRLVNVYDQLISHRIIKPCPELIKEEVETLNDRHRRSIYLDSTRKRSFRKHIEDFKQGKIDEDTKKFVQDIQAKKRDNKKFCKGSKKRLDNLWGDKAIDAFPNFESFYQYAVAKGDIRDQIKGYLERIIDPIQKNKITKMSGIIEKNIYKLPHLETTLKIVAALSYRYHLQKKEAKWGDTEDMLNLIAVTICDVYVSDDEGSREMAKMLFPNKEILSLKDFCKNQ